MAITTYNKAGMAKTFGLGPTQATFHWDGTTARGILNDASGDIPYSGGNPATVLNNLIGYVTSLPTGGSIIVFSSATTNNGAINVTAPIVLQDNVQLVGAAAMYANQTPYPRGDAIFTASGLGTTDAIFQTSGNSTTTCYGVGLSGIGIDGGNATQCWDSLNANMPTLDHCTIVRGTPNSINFRSTLTQPLAGGWGPRVSNCWLHSATNGTGVTVNSPTAHGGVLKACTMHVPGIGGANVGNNWDVQFNHLNGTTSCTYLVQTTGNLNVVTGNYLDTSKGGHNVWIRGDNNTISANYILNGGQSTVDRSCIWFESGASSPVIKGNFCDTTGNGYGVAWGGTGAPSNGIIVGNHSNGKAGSAGFVDSSGTPVPSRNTATTFIAGNSMFSGS